MSVCLTTERADILQCCVSALKAEQISQTIGQVTAKLVASFPAVKYGPLHNRHLEGTQKAALQNEKGDYDCRTTLTPAVMEEFKWWT